MPLFTYIKVVNNRNPNDFAMDVTQMQNYRTRMSALRTQCTKYTYDDLGKWRPIYKYFYMDYSFYPVRKAEFANLAEARKFSKTVLAECHQRREQILQQSTQK